MKTSMSRFQIHDDLTAPEGSQPLLRGVLSTGGQLPNFLGVLAGAPAALRGYARLRSELRHGHLEPATLERIALAVAEHHHSKPGVALHARAARRTGLRHDDIALAREWDARDSRDAALLRYLKPLVTESVAGPGASPGCAGGGGGACSIRSMFVVMSSNCKRTETSVASPGSESLTRPKIPNFSKSQKIGY